MRLDVPDTRELVIVKPLWGGYYVSLPTHRDGPHTVIMAATTIEECYDYIRSVFQKEKKDE